MPPVWLIHVAVVGCWLTALLFALLYTLKARWWDTWMGRNLFAFDFAVAAALTPGTLNYLFGTDVTGSFYAWFLVIDLLAVGALVVQRGWILMKVQPGWNWHITRRKEMDERQGADAAVAADTAGTGSGTGA